MFDQTSFIGTLLSLWWLWLGLAGFLGYLTWKNNRKYKSISVEERVLLLLEIPRANDNKELAAEQMFASLHGILRTKKELLRDGSMQEHMSFEMASIGNRIRFYVSVPKPLQNFVEGQIYAQYPTVQIHVMPDDYAGREVTQTVVHSSEIVLTENEVLPIKTFPNFEVDPLAGITATLAKLDDQEEMWIQFLARPIDDNWHTKGSKVVKKLKMGHSGISTGLMSSFGQFIAALWQPPEAKSGSANVVSERDQSRISAIEEKSKKLGYQVKIRLIYLGHDKNAARLRMQAMVGTFKQFNTTNLNGFAQSHTSFDREKVAEFRARHFIDHGKILNIEELASIFHLPHTSVETPNIVWATSKTAEPPPTLPTPENTDPNELSPFGVTNFRGTHLQFGINRIDRGRHLYIIGQTGTGKSGLLNLLTLSDVYYNQGFAVIDPHGDYAVNILRYVPKHRIEDVVYFNPSDRDFPIGFNPLEVTDPSMKSHISSELVGVLKRMFDSWGPRLEYILRYSILALLDYPNATMLDITRMLTEKKFRDDVVSHVQDPVVRNFWVTEFASWNEKFATEAVAPILNKVGAFVANPVIRNIVGQPKSTMNIRHLMDNGKILIVNLSRGLLGEDNAAILGALMVTKIQLAAMSRADIDAVENRRPFYLYVDEFQNFATDSFAVILSEARKYGLNLTVANQYTSQMEPTVRDAVFGNVGSIIGFRVGAEDASGLAKYFEPQFEASDLVQLHNRHFVTTMSINGEKTPPFSATTLNLPPSQEDNYATIIDYSRHMYSRKREDVEKDIEQTMPQLSRQQSPNTEHKPNIQSRPHLQGKNGSKSSSNSKRKSSNNNSKSNNSANKPKRQHLVEDDAEIKLR
jgi:hypothetical protein